MSNPFRSTDPLTFNEVDGIVINESAPPANVQGVPANIAVLVGRFQRGPENMLRSIGSIGELHEIFGKSDASGNTALKNKKWGSLRVIRALASDAAAASLSLDDVDAASSLVINAKYKGAYGNDLLVKVEEASGNLAQRTSITCVADVSDSLDETFFILQDKDGSVAFWIDVDNDGATEPSHGADRSVEITTIATNDDAPTVATKVAAAIQADAEFSAAAVGSVVTVTDAQAGARPAASAGDSGFTVAQVQAGISYGRKYTFRDGSANAVLADEVFDRVSVVGKTQVQLDEIFGTSQLVSVEEDSAALEPALLAFTNLATGSDGTTADTDYEDAIAVCESDRSGNILFTDKQSATIKGYLKAHVLLAPDKMVVIGPDSEAVLKGAAITEVESYRDTEGRIIYAFNPPKTIINGVEVETSPVSWVASILSNIGANIDPAFAENAQFMAGATGLKFSLSRQDYINFKNAGIAAFEFDPDIGIKLRSGITTQILNSSKTQILRRRMADFLTTSIGFFLKNYQNGPNTAAKRREVKGSVTAWDDQLIRDGILPSDAEVQSGLARLIDTEALNTDLSNGQGFFKLLYKRRINSSMRFIVLQAEIGETVVVTEGE